MGALSRLYNFIAGKSIVANQMNEELNQLIAGHNNHDGRIVTAEGNIVFLKGQVQDLADQSIPASSITSSMLQDGAVIQSKLSTAVAASISEKLPKSGGVMTGYLTLHNDPTVALHAATKNYVDNTTTAARPYITGTYTGNGAASRDITLPFTPSTVQVVHSRFGYGGTQSIGGMAAINVPAVSYDNKTFLSVGTNKMTVYSNPSYRGETNANGDVYIYVAFK